MKIHEYQEMIKYLTRPKDKLSKEEKKEVVKKFYEPKSKPMPIVKYIDRMNRLYGNDKTDEYGNEESATDRIKELAKEELKKPEKKIIKKNLIVKKELPKDWKPKYLNGNVIDIVPMIDDEWWRIFEEEPPEEKVLIRKPRKVAQGIQTILNLHNKKNT